MTAKNENVLVVDDGPSGDDVGLDDGKREREKTADSVQRKYRGTHLTFFGALS